MNFLYGTFVLPESLPRDRRAPIVFWRLNPVGALWSMIVSHPALSGMLVVSFLNAFAQLGPNNIFVLYTAHWYGWASPQIGLFMGAGALAGLIVQTLLVGRAVKRLGERLCMVVGASLYVGGLCLYGLAPTGTAFWLGIPLAALGAIGGPAWSALMSRQVGPSEQGRLAGATASLQSLSQIIGPLLFTTVFRLTVPHPGGHASPLPQGSPFYLSAVALTVAVMLAVWSTRRRPAAAAVPG